MMTGQTDSGRFGSNAGIAIGPILFIIAILAILAAAIAAGSGSFTAGTTSESNRTKSSALVEIGDNLKIGMDRITMEGGMSPASVIINPADTNTSSDLFSPSGGGIAPPSTSMANNPGTDVWHYLAGPVPGIGSGGSGTAGDIVAFLPVAAGVCAEINNRTTGVSVTPAGPSDLGDFTGGTDGTLGTATFAGWPTSAPNLTGVSTGCVYNSNATTTGYYFYQVLAIQ